MTQKAARKVGESGISGMAGEYIKSGDAAAKRGNTDDAIKNYRFAAGLYAKTKQHDKAGECYEKAAGQAGKRLEPLSRKVSLAREAADEFKLASKEWEFSEAEREAFAERAEELYTEAKSLTKGKVKA